MHKKLEKQKSRKEKCVEKLMDAKEEINPNEFFENRVAMVQEMRKNGENPYPHKFDTNLDGRDISVSLPQFLETYSNIISDVQLIHSYITATYF